MTKEYYIGLMTGTSVDSLDAVLVQFDAQDQPTIHNTHSISLPKHVQQQVQQLSSSGEGEIDQIRQLDNSIAHYSSKAVKALCQQANILTSNITAIGSHGQTVRHYPATKNTKGYSLQLGDPNIIAEATGITTVADFRRRDIAAGGQGAPLVPAFHHSVFRSKQNDRLIVNLGGIANISYLPIDGKTVGYDTGPANTLMDAWCLQHKHQRFDKDGLWAKTGNYHKELLLNLLDDSYFSSSAPKSTGREYFNLSWLEQKISEQETSGTPPEDVQATLLELTAKTVAQEINNVDPDNKSHIYICGGGAHNAALMERITSYIEPRSLATTANIGIEPDWVEATAFAWLAKQAMHKASGNLPAATGANKEVILGGIYFS
jgi:anhydro-N-acetylmuramic acid kinase